MMQKLFSHIMNQVFHLKVKKILIREKIFLWTSSIYHILGLLKYFE